MKNKKKDKKEGREREREHLTNRQTSIKNEN